MFGGKKEKALAAELAAAKERNAHGEELFDEILEQKGNAMEQFARMTASGAQLEKDVEHATEHMQRVYELAENGADAAKDIHSALIGLNNGMGTFMVNYSVFMEQIRAQNGKVTEIVEKNKHFTTPMKYISEFPASLKEAQDAVFGRIEKMREFSRNMSVLSLNAAIEAGRMGECGSRFITAAEEVRANSEAYERETLALAEQLEQSSARIAELEEQVHHLNELLKENNISMGKLYKDCVQNMASYETVQIDLRSLLPDELLGRADALQQAERENAATEEGVLGILGSIQEELKEQKSSADELEHIYEGLQRAAANGKGE